jgi:hypothetical protein
LERTHRRFAARTVSPQPSDYDKARFRNRCDKRQLAVQPSDVIGIGDAMLTIPVRGSGPVPHAATPETRASDHWVYAAVADELTRMGCDIITGGDRLMAQPVKINFYCRQMIWLFAFTKSPIQVL